MPNPIVTEKDDAKWLREYVEEHMLADDVYACEHFHTISPHYYGIINYKKQIVPEGYEDFVDYVDIENGGSPLTPRELIEMLVEDGVVEPKALKIEILNYVRDEVLQKINFDNNYHLIGDISDYELTEFADAIIECYSMDDEYQKCHCILEPFLVENEMFLTYEEAKAHLDANDYHYHEDAKVFCMTPWRAPDTARFLSTITRIDFENSDIKFTE